MMLSTMESSSTRTDVQTPELVLRAQAGDVDAFTDIVTRYHRRIVGYIVGLVVDRHMANRNRSKQIDIRTAKTKRKAAS